MFTIMKKTAHIFSDRFQDLKRPKIGPCQENDTRSGRRFACRLYPSHGPLQFITSHSFRARLCHAKNETSEEEAGVYMSPVRNKDEA